jgi:hypothetical protein
MTPGMIDEVDPARPFCLCGSRPAAAIDRADPHSTQPHGGSSQLRFRLMRQRKGSILPFREHCSSRENDTVGCSWTKTSASFWRSLCSTTRGM